MVCASIPSVSGLAVSLRDSGIVRTALRQQLGLWPSRDVCNEVEYGWKCKCVTSFQKPPWVSERNHIMYKRLSSQSCGYH